MPSSNVCFHEYLSSRNQLTLNINNYATGLMIYFLLYNVYFLTMSILWFVFWLCNVCSGWNVTRNATSRTPAALSLLCIIEKSERRQKLPVFSVPTLPAGTPAAHWYKLHAWSGHDYELNWRPAISISPQSKSLQSFHKITWLES
jgi:hypothetical protein